MKRFKLIIVCLCALLFGIPAGFGAVPAPLPEGQFVTVKDGHLWYNGQRLRLWGTNYVCDVKRSVKELDLRFARLADAGFNGLRLNLFEHSTFVPDSDQKYPAMIPVTVKGSDSKMDRLDYSIYLAKQNGMFFWISFTKAGFKPEEYVVMPDDGSRERWVKAIQEAGTYLMYVDERSERAFEEYARAILEHVNPYTGKRYADEEAIGLYEIINENGFVEHVLSNGLPGVAGEILTARWNAWLKEKYKTTDRLTKVWGKINDGETLENGTVAFQPILQGVETYRQGGVQKEFESKDKKNLTKYPYKRGEDLARFTCELYQGHTKRFIKFVRSLGKPGVGISVVPITPTGRYGLNIPMYYAASCGDFTSMGVYGFAVRPWEVAKDNPYYPYLVRSNYHPTMEQPIDLFRAKGKPYLIYECNDTRPNPFTTEFPARIAAYLIWQDCDGAFWFHWDATGYLPKLETDEDYAKNCRLPIPDTNYPNAGLIHANDEAFLAALKAMGTLFKSGGLPPAANPVQVTIGKDYLFNLNASNLGGQENQTNLETVLREKVWRYGMRVKYDPNGPSKLPTGKEPHGLINMGPYMSYFWNGESGYFRVDAPSAKVFTGFLKPTLIFKGMRITEIDRQFGMISIVAEDGLPLERSSSILITAVSRGQNTGMEVKPENLATSDYWQQGIAQMCTQSGSLPVVVDRISAVIHAPWLKGLRYSKHNFLRKTFETGTLTDKFILRGYEPTFYARLTRPQPKTIKKVVFTGNSITKHPPLADSDWNNNWGMAASSEDKDFVHRVYAMVSQNQVKSGVKPELVVDNFPDWMVKDTAKHKQLADYKADLYVIEIGDNLKDEESNEQTLGKPYEEMLKTIKTANPNAIIICTSTWGTSKNKDPLIKAACDRQGVPYVRIDIFIGDGKNRALNFKHGGVAWHPGDLGMEKIANAIWSELSPKLVE